MSRRLGCFEDAAKALRGELPELSSGLNRAVFTDPSGRWVYKVNINDETLGCERERNCDCDEEAGETHTDDCISYWSCDHRHGEGPSFDANEAEYNEIRRIKRYKTPLKRYVADATLYKVDGYNVLCMDCMPTLGSEFSSGICLTCEDAMYAGTTPERHSHRDLERARKIEAQVEDVANEFGIGDLHDENYGLTARGELRIFDLVAW